MSTSPNPSRIARSPSPSLPPPPTSAKLPPRPSASTTQHVPYSRQSLGPGLSSGALPGGLANPPGSARNFSGPARAVGGRPVSEILGGGLGVPGGGAAQDLRSPEAEAIDQWFQDLASYEVTLEEMAAASLDQNFTEELSAIEQWFRVLSEAERTAALYSLLQHSTQVQIRFFMTVLQQMARSDPMTALLSPAMGGGMQAQMEAKLANLNLRSPNNRTSFGGVPPSATKESFGGANDHPSSYLTPASALANAGDGPVAPVPRSVSGSSAASNNKASHRISAPGLLNSLSPSWAGAGQLDQVLERGPSPSAESNTSAKSNSANDARPKSTDFAGLANGPPGSAAFARSPRASGANGNGAGEDVTFPLSPSGAGGNWASMVNTPAVPMFATNHSTVQDHPAFSSLASSVPKLSDAPKRRVSGKVPLGGGNHLYNEDGDLVGQRPGQQPMGRGLQSPGSVGGGFQGAGAGAWSRSPALGSDLGGGGAGFPNNFGLGVGGLGGGQFGGLGSPSPSDIAFQMSQLQLQQLQLQQLQQLQQLGVANNGIGMGMPMMAGLGMGMSGPGGLGFGQAPRSASLRSQSGYSASGGPAGKRSPMMGMAGNVTKSPSPGRRESGNMPGSGGPEEETDLRTLEDIPQWLRTLRLHKYTPNFEGAKWRDMVLMGDTDLENKGVAALGARRKLLKTFELVRAQYGIPEPAGSVPSGAENAGVASSASGDDDEKH